MALGGLLPAIHLNQIAYGLKRMKAQSNGQNDFQRKSGILPAQEPGRRRPILIEEGEILKDEQDAEVCQYRRGKPERPGATGDPLHAKGDKIVRGDRSQKNQDIDRHEGHVKHTAGGQQQRLCIARAIAVSPEVILMDEPCSALDPIATARIEELIDEIKDKYSIVIVTHSMQQAARVSQRTAFFHLGILVEEGDTEQIFTNPRDERTQDYITGRFG